MKQRNKIFLKTTLFFLIIFVFSLTNFAATYYVSAIGNDANSGLTPETSWKSIAKVNSASLVSGDIVLFRRGDIFIGPLISPRSYLTFDAFGTGEKPIISGFQTITGWVNQGNGIYAAPTTAKVSCNMVTVNGVNTPMGRYPKTGWLTFESSVGRTSITDTQLASTPNWTGAEVVIKKRDFLIDRSLITNHTANTITYTSGSANNPVANGGYNYFIQKSQSALTQLGDWYCNGSNLYMYFGTNNPNSYIVKASIVDRLIDINSKNTNIFQNLTIEGSNLSGAYFTLSANIQFKNCDFNNHGSVGISGGGSTTITVDACTFSNCNGRGIGINAAGSTISNCILNNIYDFPGMGDSNGLTGYGINLGSVGGIIEYNQITNCGYLPIYFYGNNSKVRYNKVDGFGSIIDVGGGIYTYLSASVPAAIGIEVYRNVVMNGTSNGFFAEGVANNIQCYDNTIINIGKNGIRMNTPIANSINNNLFYNCAISGISMANIYSPEATTVASNNSVLNNAFLQNTSSQLFMSLQDNKTYSIGNFGTSNNNFFLVGVDGLNLFKTEVSQPSLLAALYNIINWKNFSKQELNSTQTVTNLSEVQFEYNTTKSAKTIALSVPMIDIKGVKYSGSITLQPFTSVLLMKDQTIVLLPTTGVYYVSSLGNDANSGLSPNAPWKTIAKVNSATLSPGNSVLFRRGDIFYGSLIPKNSGTSLKSITYGAYGTGNKPIISGFQQLSAWVSLGNGIYSSTTTAKSPVSMVTVNGINTPIGRYPKTDWLSFETFNGRTSITDNQLTSTPNWTGAEVVIKKSNYIIDRSLITDHTGTTITYTSGSTYNPLDAEHKYFIQNHLSTLTQLGDWYSKGTTFYMYFGNNNPSLYNVKASVNDILVDASNKSYLIFDNLSFEGGNQKGISTYFSISITVKNCDFNFMGEKAINSVASQKTIIENSTASNCNGTSIYLNSTSSLIKNNIVSNGGLIPGMGAVNGDTYSGIVFYGTGSICEYNTVKDVGYNGIMFYSNNCEVRYNLIDGFCKFLFDGGGVYTYLGSATVVQTGMKMRDNIIMNGGGNGLYSDGTTNNLEIYNNSVANVLKWGIHLNEPRYLNVHDNTTYNCGYCGIDVTNQYPAEVAAANTSISKNIVAQGNVTQLMMYLTDARTYNVGNFGTSNYNYFVAGADGLNLFRTQVSLPGFKNTFYTFPNWKIFSSQELNSVLNITTLADLRFEYNATAVPKIITLSVPMVDPKGIKYSTTVTLQPYTSIILMKDVMLKSGSIPATQSSFLMTNENILDTPVTMELFPNPTIGKFTVRFSQLPIAGSKIEVFDLAGRKITSRDVINSSEMFEFTSILDGIYVVKSTIGSDEITKKLIVTK